MVTGFALKRALFAAAAAAALAPTAAAADKALVIGVNKYPGLKNADLAGCVSDSRSMEQMLTDYGFQVRRLSDSQATKQGIVNALAAMKTQCTESERFVFYFAGHGTDQTVGDQAALLPHDAQHESADNDLKRTELYEAIKAIPARSHTALLDSCYSGGMLPTFRALRSRTRRNRYYARDIGGGSRSFQAGAQQNVPVNDGDPRAQIAGGPGVCYYTAAKDNEQAAEEQFGSDRHGVFTYFLTRMLAPKARDSIRPVWADVNTQVSGQVAERLRDQQHPMLSPEFGKVPLFEARAGAPPAPADANLWDVINTDNLDPAKLELRLVPNRTKIEQDEEITFEVKVGEKGYLAVFERGTSAKMRLQFPLPQDDKETIAGTVDQAAVNPGVIKIPDGKVFLSFKAKDVGHEYLKAILFPSREMAEAFISKFPDGATREQLRDLQRVSVKKVNFITSDITFEVVKKK